MLDSWNILHAGVVGRNQRSNGVVQAKPEQIYGAASPKKVTPNGDRTAVLCTSLSNWNIANWEWYLQTTSITIGKCTVMQFWCLAGPLFVRGRAVDLLWFGLYYSETPLVSSYDPGTKYIPGIWHRLGTIGNSRKTAQFLISNHPSCVALEQLTGTPPIM